MELSKEAIINKTNYGLNIYAHVLQQYYSGTTVLSLSGRDCKPALNPFNNNKQTLSISIVDNLALHIDTEVPTFQGDAFDFASLHYGVKDQELLEKLNEEMSLHIGEVFSFYDRTRVIVQPVIKEEKKPVAPSFSYFVAPVTNTIPAKAITLVEAYKIIRSEKYAQQTISLRSIDDKKKAKEYKAANFDYVTFSGIFSKRADKALQKHSGLITIDLDHIWKPEEWVQRLLHDDYFETELLFVSPSGDGLKWVIPIDLSIATHLEYFKSISNYMQLTYGLKSDTSGSDTCRACFLPHDPNIYINPKYL
jgi:hypothetical protein